MTRGCCATISLCSNDYNNSLIIIIIIPKSSVYPMRKSIILSIHHQVQTNVNLSYDLVHFTTKRNPSTTFHLQTHHPGWHMVQLCIKHFPLIIQYHNKCMQVGDKCSCMYIEVLYCRTVSKRMMFMNTVQQHLYHQKKERGGKKKEKKEKGYKQR